MFLKCGGSGNPQMVKEKPLNIIINPYFCRRLLYNAISGNIKLPNFEGGNVIIGNSSLFIQELTQSLTHEYIHKWLHENFNLLCCRQWDNVDKKFKDGKGIYIYSAY